MCGRRRVTGLISLAYLPDSLLHFGVVEDCLQLAGPVCIQVLRRALSHWSVCQCMIQCTSTCTALIFFNFSLVCRKIRVLNEGTLIREIPLFTYTWAGLGLPSREKGRVYYLWEKYHKMKMKLLRIQSVKHCSLSGGWLRLVSYGVACPPLSSSASHQERSMKVGGR